MMYSVLGLLMSLPFILDDVWSIHYPSTYTQTNFVLKNHIMSSTLVKNYQDCYDKCASTEDCHSMNYYDRTKRCELNKGSHLSSPVDLAYDGEGTYSVYERRSVMTCSDKYCSTDTICVVDNQSNNYHCKDCASPFGIGINLNKIPNSSMTASSVWGTGLEPWRGRLNNYPFTSPYEHNLDSACWAAGTSTAGEYLQVDLGQVVYVTMVATQGRPYFGNFQYVTKYSLAYKINENFVDYEVGGAVKIFQGNSDRSTIVTNRLPEKIKTQVIRFVVQEWQGYISMRAEVYGCPITG